MTRELQIRSYGCIPSGKDRLNQVLAVVIVFVTRIPTEERLSSSSCGFRLVFISHSLATRGFFTYLRGRVGESALGLSVETVRMIRVQSAYWRHDNLNRPLGP
jgi:hypothetical protein